MIYKAMVMDNSNFFRTGTIRVRIAGFYQRKIEWNLSQNYPTSIEEGETDDERFSEDFNAILSSPMGGGRNYGTLILPQINEKGLVAFLGNNKRNPIWLGSLFEVVRDANYSVEYVNIPSDKPESEGSNSDGIINGQQNMNADSDAEALKKNVVIRTKNTVREGSDPADVDWEQRPTSNIITIGDQEINITHFTSEDGWNGTTPQKYQSIHTGKNADNKDSITAKVVNDSSGNTGKIELTEDGFIATVGQDDVSIEFKDGELFFRTNGKPINLENASEIKFMGESDNLVTYADLADFLDTFLDHEHIAPTGKTEGLIDGTGKPLSPELSQLLKQFKAEKIKTE